MIFDLFDDRITKDHVVSFHNGVQVELGAPRPEKLDIYVERIQVLYNAIENGTLYAKVLSGDREGSLGKVVFDEQYLINLPPKVDYGPSRYNRDKATYRIRNDTIYCRLTFKGTKNSFKVDVGGYYCDLEFYIAHDMETKYVKKDIAAAKAEYLAKKVFTDIDGVTLAVGDPVLYINARYGTKQRLSHGKIIEFKAAGSNGKFSSVVVIQNDSDPSELSEVSDPSAFVYAMVSC